MVPIMLVNFSIMKFGSDLAHEQLINVIGKYYGILNEYSKCQPHPKVAIYVVKQLKKDSFC